MRHLIPKYIDLWFNKEDTKSIILSKRSLKIIKPETEQCASLC